MSSIDINTQDPNPIFFDKLKRTILNIGLMILLSSVLSYITIIIKSLHNPSFETNVYDDSNIIKDDTIQKNDIIEILKIVTSTTSFFKRIQITNNLFNPTKWIKSSEILQAYSLLFTVEPILTSDNEHNYFNHIYRALLAIPFLNGMSLYFNSPHIGRTPELNDDINSIYNQSDNNTKILQWDTTISQYIVYYLYSVISKSVNTNLFIYKVIISYISSWNETILFLLYAFFGSFIIYGMGIVSTIVLFITSIGEIPKLFSDRMPEKKYNTGETEKIGIKWSVNSLQFLNPYRLFVVWLFGVGYTFTFLFLSLFIFLFTLFIPLSLTGKVSKYFISIKDNIPFRFYDTNDNDNDQSKLKPSKFAKVNIDLHTNMNYFTYFSNLLYKHKNYIFYIIIFYLLLDITLSYTTSIQLITFIVFIFIIWLLNAFNYSINIDKIQSLIRKINDSK
jgi:hypothetical protein